MSIEIKKCAVLGAGVMGAQIAGHISNAGIPSLLFDMNDELAKNGVEGLKKLTVTNLGNLTPHKLTVWLSYSHPPVLTRIKALNNMGK